MRLDDPVILERIEQLEEIADGLRMAAGFPPRFPAPETTASRKPMYECQRLGCSRLCRTQEDLDAHIATDHDNQRRRLQAVTGVDPS